MAMILIVEDDPNVARLVGLVLTRNGHQSEVVSDGDAALRRVREIRPDIIFADLGIKGMSGQTLCSTLKSEEATRSIPYIILSGDRDLAEKAQDCGADDYMGKPFEFDDLLRLVAKYAQSRTTD